MHIISQFFIKNIENTLKIYSSNFIYIIESYIDRSLRYNTKLSLTSLFEMINQSMQIFITNTITSTLEKMDEDYFNSKERKELYYPKGSYSRTIITLFGEITFTRRAYVDKKTGKNHFYYIDSLLNIPPRIILDEDVVRELLFLVGKHASYSTAGEILGSFIFKNSPIDSKHKYLSRATVFNYVKRADIEEYFPVIQKKVDQIFIELDEHYISIQKVKKSNIPEKKKMVKAAKIYSSRTKDGYVDRYIILDNLESTAAFKRKIYEYVYRTFDLDYVKNIYILGDGANWIKSAKDVFNSKKSSYMLDMFHGMQALQRITTWKNMNDYEYAKSLVELNKRSAFKSWANDYKLLYPERANIIEEKSKYILNNWAPLQRLLKCKASCAMEGCISHTLASIFTSRPKGFNAKMLVTRLKLRAMYINSFDDRAKFFSFLDSTDTVENFNNLDFSILDDLYKGDTYKLNLKLNLSA